MSEKLLRRLKKEEDKLWRHEKKCKTRGFGCVTCQIKKRVIGTLKDAIQECNKEAKKAHKEGYEKGADDEAKKWSRMLGR